jgi:hypothetical protein
VHLVVSEVVEVREKNSGHSNVEEAEVSFVDLLGWYLLAGKEQ